MFNDSFELKEKIANTQDEIDFFVKNLHIDSPYNYDVEMLEHYKHHKAIIEAVDKLIDDNNIKNDTYLYIERLNMLLKEKEDEIIKELDSFSFVKIY